MHKSTVCGTHLLSRFSKESEARGEVSSRVFGRSPLTIKFVWGTTLTANTQSVNITAGSQMMASNTKKACSNNNKQGCSIYTDTIALIFIKYLTVQLIHSVFTFRLLSSSSKTQSQAYKNIKILIIIIRFSNLVTLLNTNLEIMIVTIPKIIYRI